MKLKLNEQGYAVVRDGKPVYIHADGREEAFDAAGAMKLLVGKHFETSPVMAGLKIPHDVAAAKFGDSFRFERGQLVAYDKGDIPVYSHTRHGEAANFDEALASLVERYPHKDMILRKDGASTPGKQGQTTTITRAQFDVMPQVDRARFIKAGGRIGDGADTGAATAPAPSHHSGGKTITRAQYEATAPMERAALFKGGAIMVD